ncbi:MAG: alpha/beta hydrolase [Proteobacteria bacterium]|nr:alpha/beta hydrolase [Pseudomonadota bacterium]
MIVDWPDISYPRASGTDFSETIFLFGDSLMKLQVLAVVSLALSAACGRATVENSSLSSDDFSIRVLGIEMGSCTQDELKQFVAGEKVPAISDKLPADQQKELRVKFGRVIRISSSRIEEALKSEAGNEARSLLKVIFPSSFNEEFVNATFSKSVADDSFTLLEFVSLYPEKQLRVNGLAFVSKKDALEKALIKLEQDFAD